MKTNTRAERDVRRRAAYARQRAQRDAAAIRNAVREDARAAARRAAEAIEALEDGWGGRSRALNELDELSQALLGLQREELKLRAQRDELIDALRAAGASWTLLSLRTGLSRQALIKRRGVADVSGRAYGSVMGSIEPYSTSPGRRYRVRYRKPDHSQTDKRGFRTERDPELFLASVTVSMTRGEWIDPSNSRMTVREWGETWFEAQVQVKPATRSVYRYNLDHHIYPLWGERRLVEIGHAEVQDWVGALSARLKPSTVKQIYLVLSGLMKFAIRDGRLVRNPCEFIRLPHIERKRKGYLTVDQVAHVASLCSSEADLVVFLAFTGLRWGEMMTLRVVSADFDSAGANVKAVKLTATKGTRPKKKGPRSGNSMVAPTGVDPVTSRFSVVRSTN